MRADKKAYCGLILTACLLLGAACRQSPSGMGAVRTRPLPPGSSPALRLVVEAAIEQTKYTLYYDQSYTKISYPGGDVPAERGACTDVIVRAFRKGGVDLQKEIHEDMARAFSAYPTKWGIKGPDSNIDHRRVPNLRTYFERKGR